MKKIIISILLIFFTLGLSIPTYCDDVGSDPVGKRIFPVIEASSLEDFSYKLNKEIIVTHDNVLAGNATPEEMTKLTKERIEKGVDYLYIPDVDCEVTSIKAFISSLAIKSDYYLNYETSKYEVSINSNDEVAHDIHSTVEYDGMEVSIYYDSMTISAEHLYDCGYYEKILLHDLVLYYDVRFGSTEFLLRIGSEPYRLTLDKQLTEDEISQLPRGLFYPKVLTITDIKNGNYLDADELEEGVVIVADEPTESYDVECVDIG